MQYGVISVWELAGKKQELREEREGMTKEALVVCNLCDIC